MHNEKIVIWETKYFDQIIIMEPTPQLTIDLIIAKLKAQGSKTIQILEAY